MKILLIDNHSKHTKELIEQLGHESIVLDYKKIDLKTTSADDYDAIILSGGNTSIINHENEYSSEIELIKSSTKPVLGICLGFELIAKAFDEKLERLPVKTSGFINIRICDDDKVFDDLPVFFQAYQSHIYHVKELAHLKKLALSSTGIEAFKHSEKMIYGMQFHPEMSEEARIIIKNFLMIISADI